ncbi:unnamed protein product [Malus baccata var. baccata]
MEDVFHELSQSFNYWHVDPLDTQVLDPLGPHEKYFPCVPLEIYFEVSRNYSYFDRDLSEDGTLTLVHQSEVQVRSYKSKIVDASWLQTRNAYVRPYLSRVLSFLKIHEDVHSGMVETIIEGGIRIRNLDSKKGPKVLRLRVGIKIYHIQIRCEDCSKQRELERDALIKKMLKRVRVVADADDVNEEESGRGRKRQPVVRESEVCPICLEKFVVGSEDVTSMPCTHMFHENCIWRWFKQSHLNCPICRFEMFIELGSQGEGDIRI